MSRVLKWFILFVAIVAVIAISFSLYTNFLMDYSLQNLEKTLTLTSEQVKTASPIAQKVYQSMIQDLALEEAQQEKPDYENIMLLNAASRSLDEVETRAGEKRAKFYLQKAAKLRKQSRGAILKAMDEIYARFYSFWTYLAEKSSSKKEVSRGKIDYASIFLLSQAEEKEKSGKYADAQELYKKFMGLYPQHPDRGFVMIALSQLLIRDNKLDDADDLLERVQKTHAGGQEDQIAANWRARIDTLKKRQSLIKELEGIVESSAASAESKENARLKLGVTYLSVYRFAEAEKSLKELSESKNPEIRGKSKFYLGWLYKMSARYEDGAKVLEELLDNPELSKELGLGLKAQLADLYYLKKDIPKALAQYEKISEETNSIPASVDIAKEAWLSLSELEQSSIYFFETGDAEKGENLLEGLDQNLNLADFTELKEGLQDIRKVSLRDRAFQALQAGRVQVAFNLMREYEKVMPDDAWTMSGLSTIYLLFGDYDQAQAYALKGYQLRSDEYTTSVLGYVNSFTKNDEKTITMYRAALERNPNYVPARFNLACIYLGSNRYQEALDLLLVLETKLSRRENFLKSKVLNNMGYALWWLGRVKEAEAKFQESQKLTPQFTVAEHNLSQISAGAAPEMVNLKEQ